jgi:hypothetical protein
MPDTEPTPVEQAPTPQQQPSSAPNAQPSDGPPSGYVEKARFDGLVRKVEELTLSNRSLNDQLAAKTSEVEQLKGQLTVKDTEKTVAVGERDKSLQTALTENAELQKELTELRALKLKIDTINEIQKPELLKIINHIPNLTDGEALKVVMTDFAGFGDSLVKQREEQLLSGLTPTGGGPAVQPSTPSTAKAWQEHVNSLPLGSTERGKAMDDYGDWLEKQHSA